jgi:DUF438 domain-containing protein
LDRHPDNILFDKERTMSEIQVIDPERQVKLKEIIRKLHEGRPVSEVKKEFARLIQGVSAAEVAAMEQSLIDGGMPVEEVQRLCEVHVQVFEHSLGKAGSPSEIAGHPVHTMLAENRIASRKAAALRAAARAWAWGLGGVDAVRTAFEDLSPVIIHYTRKENQLFPYLERQGFTGPSRVMWGKHDEIRALFSDARKLLAKAQGEASASRALAKEFHAIARSIAGKVKKMIFMEEHILIPEATRRLSVREWAEIRNGEDAIGFAWVKPESLYDAGLVLATTPKTPVTPLTPRQATPAAPDTPAVPPASAASAASAAPASETMATAPDLGASLAGLIDLSTGQVGRDILDIALKTLPVDISIVDDQDRVLYYSDNPHRIFPRSPAAIGRTVQNCHPQKSVDTVNKILESFRKREKDRARFWIQMGERFILIEYYALHDAAGIYRGTLEVSQDLTELRALQGQRRLLDWD